MTPEESIERLNKGIQSINESIERCEKDRIRRAKKARVPLDKMPISNNENRLLKKRAEKKTRILNIKKNAYLQRRKAWRDYAKANNLEIMAEEAFKL